MSRRSRRRDKSAAEPVRPAAAAPPPPVLPGSPLPPARRWLFRAVLFALPWLLLLLVELLLRAIGVGVPLDFVLRQPVEGETRLLSNPRFTWLFFEPAVARVASPFSLPLVKPQGSLRVFVLGSSAAQGDPEPAFGVARLVEVLLRAQYPGVEIEVVNAAATAVNSHYVYQAARECLRLEPDLLVIYAGNNEVVGPFGAGTVLTASAPPLTLVRAEIAAQRTRLGQLASRGLRAASRGLGGSRAPGAWHGMGMFLEQQLRRDDPALERTYRSYERNLADSCRLARSAGVPVVLSTVAVNLRSCGPFASLHASALDAAARSRWDALFGEAVRLEDEGRWADAAGRLEQAVALDPGHAESLFRLGRCELRLGREAAAREHLSLARDLDTLRFRADTRTNAIVREVAGREGARLADAEQALAAGAPGGVPGDEIFLDHVHLNFAGNYRLALSLLEPIRAALPELQRRSPGRPVPSLEDAARLLVYTELDRYRIAETMQQRLREAPFTNQPDHAEHVKRVADELAALRARGDAGAVDAAVAEYEQALAVGRAHWTLRERYAVVEARLGHATAAAAQWQLLARELPQYPAFQLQLARAWRDAGRFAEARAALQQVLDYQPDAAVTLVELARLELKQGHAVEAARAARRAVAADPRDANALNLLAASLCPRGECPEKERTEAVELLQRALEAAPESDAIRRDLDTLRRRKP